MAGDSCALKAPRQSGAIIQPGLLEAMQVGDDPVLCPV